MKDLIKENKELKSELEMLKQKNEDLQTAIEIKQNRINDLIHELTELRKYNHEIYENKICVESELCKLKNGILLVISKLGG